MERSEFTAWLNQHTLAFPEVRAWFDQQGDENRDALLELWRRALSRVHLADAMRCTERMISGQVQHPNRFEISRLPAAVIAACPYRPLSVEELRGKVYNPHTGTVE